MPTSARCRRVRGSLAWTERSRSPETARWLMGPTWESRSSRSAGRAGFSLACLLAVGVVNVAVPQLEEVVADSSLPFIPENAEAVQTFEAMDQAFGNGKTKSILYVVAEREGGLTEVDRQYVKGLVPRLDDDHYVSSIQDVAANQRLFDSLVSEDGEAVYLQVGIVGRHRCAGGDPPDRRGPRPRPRRSAGRARPGGDRATRPPSPTCPTRPRPAWPSSRSPSSS